MTSDVLSDEFWVPECAEWAELNKQRFAARKEEWRRIQPTLKIITRMHSTPPGFLSVHKSLFFKGCLPENEKIAIEKNRQLADTGAGGEKMFFSFPLFYLWYHPNLTKEAIEQCFDRFTRSPLAIVFKGVVSAEAIKSSIRNFFGLQRRSGKYDEYGIMGGREELIAPYFILGSQSGKVENSFRDGWFNPCCRSLLDHSISGMTVLDGKREQDKLELKYRFNPRGTGQYVWPQISHYIQRNFGAVISNPLENELEQSLKSIDIWIQKLLYHGEYPLTQTDDPLAIACRDRILGQYRNGELAEWLSERFARRERLGMEIF